MALSNHFQLMRDFLGVQDSIAPRALAQAPVSGWTGCLPLSFPAAVEFVSLDAAMPLEALGPHLGPTDLAHFEHEIARCPPRRQRDWLAGRIAARRAVAVWTGTPQLDPDIRYDQNGRPFLSAGSGTIFLSISHKDGVAVAAAADRRLGIDLERFSALRDPAGVARIALTPAESAVLGQTQLDEAFLVAIAWSAKEAASKSLGQPLLGRETWPAITAIDAARCEIILAHADGPLAAFYAIDGDFICTLATPVGA
jgi:4'-phosphopantetheinyl transferase EntD